MRRTRLVFERNNIDTLMRILHQRDIKLSCTKGVFLKSPPRSWFFNASCIMNFNKSATHYIIYNISIDDLISINVWQERAYIYIYMYISQTWNVKKEKRERYAFFFFFFFLIFWTIFLTHSFAWFTRKEKEEKEERKRDTGRKK